MPEFSGPNVEVTSETKDGGLRRTLRRCRTVRRACMFSSDDAQHSVSGTRGITVNLRQCLVLIATLWPVSAFSAAGDTFFTGDILHRYCTQPSESCTNYIAGVLDALIAVGATQKTPIICLHDRTELGQAVDVSAKYLRAHPETTRERRGHRHYSLEARVPL
jgi:Rap1a immunity proteins